MKKKRLKLGALEVKSFVTEDLEKKINTIKGGVSGNNPKRPTDTAFCGPTPGTWCYVCPEDNSLADQFLG